MADEVNVQLRFTVETERGRYSDALYFPIAEWESRDEQAVEAMKQARADAWVAHVAEASSRVPTREDYEVEKEGIEQQIADLMARKVRVEAELAKPAEGKG